MVNQFKSMDELYTWCSQYHGNMINLRQFKMINKYIADLGQLKDEDRLHIPYIEEGVRRYIMPVIEQGKVQHIIPDDNRKYIHLLDSGCLKEAYITTKNEEEGVQLIDYSVYFKLSPYGTQKTSMKLRSTIEDVIIKGKRHSVWIKAELFDENH